MDETTTRVLLERVLAEAPPAAAVDLDRVVGRARRTRRRHTTFLVAAAAVTVLVAGLGAVALRGGGEDPTVVPVDPAASTPAALAPSGSALTTAPTAFDPLRNAVQSSWLPAGERFRTVTVRRTEASLIVSRRDSTLDWWVRLAARGADFEIETSEAGGTSVPGPAIGGVPSRWYGDLHSRVYELRWEWSPGAKASVRFESQDGDRPNAAATLATAVRLAESVRVATVPLRWPYIVEVPSGYRPFGAGTSYRDADFQAGELDFEEPGSGSVVAINLAANSIGPIYTRNTTINGRPAQTLQDGDFFRIRVRYPTVQFETSCIRRPVTIAHKAGAAATCLRTAESTHLVADPLAPDDWPISPLAR